MTNEELVVEIQNGHTEYLLQLWEQVQKFVRMQAGKYLCSLGDNPPVELDELYDSGYLALLSSVRLFSPDKGFTFLTYYNLALKTYFRRTAGIKVNDPLRAAVSLSTPTTDDGDCTIEDSIADDIDIVEEVSRKMSLRELHNALEISLATLEPYEERIIRLKYYNNMSTARIAQELNISPDMVHYYIKKALRQLRSPEAIAPLMKFADMVNIPKKYYSYEITRSDENVSIDILLSEFDEI